MTVPNLITTLRIILTPIFIIYLLEGDLGSALVVFTICGVSDGLDGLLARTLKQKSTLGSYLDPIADKLILVSTFVAFAVMEFIPTWLAVTVISRDVLISLGVLFLFINKVEIRIRPSIVSKVTTCLQFITVISILVSEYITLPENLLVALFWLTGVFTISSGLHYIHSWYRLMGEGGGENPSS